MDTDVSHEVSRPTRRTTRHSSAKLISVEPTPRRPLKRTKSKKQVKAVNGSRGEENDSDDEESPGKKARPDNEEATGGADDELEMDVQESNENVEKNDDQEIIQHKASTQRIHQRQTFPDRLEDVNLSARVMLERCRTIPTANKQADLMKTERVKLPTKEPRAANKSATQLKLENSRDVPISTASSMAQYRQKMEAKPMPPGILNVSHDVPWVRPTNTTRHLVNNIPAQTGRVQCRKQEEKGKENKSAGMKKRPEYSPRGSTWYLWCLVLLVLLSCVTSLVYKRVAGGGAPASRSVEPGLFAAQFPLLMTQFPNQHPELWRMSKIHLERHLQTARPKEPVSLILTAGRGAETTLRCLAQGLASTFSSALNASVLHIDGASKASQNSDQVKWDIDTQLQGAFEGDKPVAVIHRFEELPPGSTIIFYRYCDHENAAYKHVFFVFTVLLPQHEVRAELSMKEVEEMVQDYVKERLVDANNQTAFNRMDLDKFGGLWSRISHLTLPVVSEEEVEQRGC